MSGLYGLPEFFAGNKLVDDVSHVMPHHKYLSHRQSLYEMVRKDLESAAQAEIITNDDAENMLVTITKIAFDKNWTIEKIKRETQFTIKMLDRGSDVKMERIGEGLFKVSGYGVQHGGLVAEVVSQAATAEDNNPSFKNICNLKLGQQVEFKSRKRLCEKCEADVANIDQKPAWEVLYEELEKETRYKKNAFVVSSTTGFKRRHVTLSDSKDVEPVCDTERAYCEQL